MATHADDIDILHIPGPQILVQCFIHGHPKLIFGQAGGYIGMGLRIYIRVDAKGYRSPGIQFRSNLLQSVQFLGRLNIKHQDARIQGFTHFRPGLTHPGINDFL